MTTLIIASLRANAGKTSMIVGLTEYLKRPVGYMKPFGDACCTAKKGCGIMMPRSCPISMRLTATPNT